MLAYKGLSGEQNYEKDATLSTLLDGYSMKGWNSQV